MYCLDKFQALLSDFLGIDIKTLPKLEDNLKKAGYIGIQKGKEVEYFSKGLSEFGENYPQYYHKPQEAIAHLLETKEGQVAGAFYKEELGDIDVVWGDSHFGLQHILERRTQDFIKEGFSEAEAKAKAREFVESIPEIIENGKIRKEKTRAFIEFNDKQSVIALDYKGDDSRKWLLTAYKNYDDAPSPAYSHQDRHNINTSSETRIDGDIKDNSTTNLSKEQIPQEQYKQTLKEIEEQEQYYHKLDYKPSIKPILENLQKEFKNNDYAILNWKERNSVGKMVVKKTNFRSYEDIKNTLQAYENYAKAGNDASKEIEAIQKALKDIKAQYTKKEQVRQEAQQALDELKEQKRALRLRYYKADIFTQYPHQTLAIQSKENKRSEVELLKHIKESNYLESITQAKEAVEQIRKDIQRDFNITPIAEFGTNYAEFYRDGANAIAKILREKQGQVAGAFYKEGLGDIDVVWGDSHFGLQHILERRTQDFIKEGLSEAEAKAKAKEFVESISKIIESGKVVKDDKGRLRIEFDNFIVGIKDNWKGKPTNKWIVTSYAKKEGGESLYTSSPITKGETLPLNSKADSTIDKALLSKVQSKFKYDEKKASDLLEWHKDSSPITKDKDGLPKVFYHGSKAGNIKEFKSEFDESGLGFWFVDDIEYAKRVDDNLYEVFLNVKNPIDFRGGDNPNYPYKLQEEMDKLGLSLERYTYQTEKTKEFLQSKGYDALIMDGSNKEHPFIAIFDSNQIKHIDNKGSYTDSSGNITSTKPKDTQAEHRYFNEASPNIYQTNPHIGAGLVSGTLAGVERDENGNIVGFDPSKFALGFLGGAVGSKAVSQGFKVIKDNPQLKESLKQELANTLAKGWEASVDKYPILKALEPMKIMQSQKGRIAQAGHLINKMENTHLQQAKENLKAIDTSTLTKEQQEILKVFLGEKSQASIKGKDLKDIHTLEQGSRKKGAKKILIKHYGVEKTGSLSDDEILDISKVIKKGKINADTFSEGEDFIRYGYDLNENGVNYRVVVDEYNNGKKIFDYYSDRNFTDFKGVYSPELPNTQSDSTTETIKMQLKNKALQKSDFIYYAPYERDNESYNSNTRLEFLNQNDIMPSKNGRDMQDIRTKLLDIEQKINYSYLKNIASKIPSPLTQDEFLAQFPNKNRVHIKTPISEVEIQPKLIWEHLQKQSNKKEDRNSISGAIIQTLQEPLFITKDKKEAFYFYRPFLDSKGVLNLVSVQIPKSNRLQYKTSYIASKQRMMKMLKEYDLVYERF